MCKLLIGTACLHCVIDAAGYPQQQVQWKSIDENQKKYVRPAVLNAGYKVLDPEHSNDYIKGFLEYLDDQYNPGEGPTEDGLIFIPFEKPKRSRSKAKKRAESSDLEDSGKSNIF